MRYPAVLSLVLTLFASITASAPVEGIQQGSKHNIYLVTCTRQSISTPDCPLIILCEPPVTTRVTYTAAAYYPNGAIEAGEDNPSQLATVSEPAAPWEGAQRVANIAATGVFSSNIDAGAKALAKGQIAGSAKLASEDFTCFRDGQSSFKLRNGLGIVQGSCTADYWCPSIQV